MKDVISVDSIILQYRAELRHGLNSFSDSTNEERIKRDLHSLLISKLPEKKQYNGNVFTVPKYSATEENRKTGYNSAIDDMHRVIDEMFGVQNG